MHVLSADSHHLSSVHGYYHESLHKQTDAVLYWSPGDLACRIHRLPSMTFAVQLFEFICLALSSIRVLAKSERVTMTGADCSIAMRFVFA